MSQAYPVALVKLNVGKKVWTLVLPDISPIERASGRQAGYLKRWVCTNPTFRGESHAHWDRLLPTTQLAIEACESSLESFLWGILNYRSCLIESGAYRRLSDEEIRNGARQAHVIDIGYWGQLMRNRDSAFPSYDAGDPGTPWVRAVHSFELLKVKLQCVFVYTDEGMIYQLDRMKILKEEERPDGELVSDENLGVYDHLDRG